VVKNQGGVEGDGEVGHLHSREAIALNERKPGEGGKRWKGKGRNKRILMTRLRVSNPMHLESPGGRQNK